MVNLIGRKPIWDQPEYPKKSATELESNPNNKKVIEAIKQCNDPEFDIDLWTFGLIYDIVHKKKGLNIVMTFTSPMCPCADIMQTDIKEKVTAVGFENVKIDVVFNPRWQPSEELRQKFGPK